MSNLSKWIFSFTLLLFIFSSPVLAVSPLPDSGVTSSQISFPDVPQTHWSYEAITAMANKGAISGYPNGKFGPNDAVTREQFAKMMVIALDLPEVSSKTSSFEDVPIDIWSSKYIESVKNYLTGYMGISNNSYNRTENALREDIAYALVKACSLDLEIENVQVDEVNSLFFDADKISEPYKIFVLAAYRKGLISGYADKTFRPDGTLTRAEAAKILYTASIFKQGSSNNTSKQEDKNTIVGNGKITNIVSHDQKITKEGEWIYYIGLLDGKLYKVKTDGTETTKLSDDFCTCLSVVGNCIYYCNEYPNGYGYSCIYKISTDGTNKTEVCSNYLSSFQVKDDYIYYTSFDYNDLSSDNEYRLHRVKTDGTEDTILKDGDAVNVVIYDDWIYYSSNSKIYRMKFDGSENTVVLENLGTTYTISEGTIYYFNEDMKLMKASLDGSNKTELCDALPSSSLEVNGDWIYYSATIFSEGLYKIKTDGSQKTQLTDDATGRIYCIIDDWIFYDRYHGELSDNLRETAKIKTDGTLAIKVE